MTFKDAEQYLNESKVSLAIAIERAARGEKNSYWHAWVHSFAGRVGSLERVIPRLKKREADTVEMRHPDVIGGGRFVNSPSRRDR